jgi:L,D-transpeptidase YcbB
MTSFWIERVIRAATLSTAFLTAFFGPGQSQTFPPSDARGGGDIVGPPSSATPASRATCVNGVAEYPRASVFQPPEQPAPERRRNPKKRHRVSEGRLVLSDDPTPTVQPATAFCTLRAAEHYRRIASNGGWPFIPRPLRSNAAGEDLQRLRQRLSIEGDLQQEDATEEGWDDTLRDALERFQFRAAIEQSGEVDEATLRALNVPADVRARELEASARRIGELKIPFDHPYVVVNIPAASVEAIENSRVVQRHAAIVGKVDHPSPQLKAAIQSITINPTWTIPRSIVENELIPKLTKNPGYLRRAKLVVLDQRGRKVNVRLLRRSAVTSFIFRQQPGSKNALGRLRIDMPNPHAVYMHDTPMQRLFAENYRFLSHGCVRVDGIDDLASWLLVNSGGHWDREAIAHAMRDGGQKKIKLSKVVPVAWVYLDAWESADGTVHFAPDSYDLDGTAAQLESQAQ